MLYTLIPNKVYCHIFDRRFAKSTHTYSKKKLASNELEVKTNIRAILTELSADDILILNQVHGNFVIDADLRHNQYPEADGAVTTRSNYALSIQTADCSPVLLYCADSNIIGAVHAGWRGAKSDIIANAVNIMHKNGARDVRAFIGPTIMQNSYEVDRGYFEDFVNENPSYTKFFINNLDSSSGYMFDLPSFIEMKLKLSGITDIINLKEDTYTQPEKYPSYRRSCKKSQTLRHSILSTIIMCSKR